MRRIARANGGRLLRVKDLDQSETISICVVRHRFGSWERALRKAGLRRSRSGRRYTDDQCFANLARVWSHYGRALTFVEMMARPSTVGVRAYLNRFGTWRRTLAAFVERANKALDDPEAKGPWRTIRRPPTMAAARLTNAAAIEPPTREARRARRERARVATLSLRFQVLARDRFCCVLCGNSPATDPQCKLHVDHMVPFSRGGRTTAGNLRTLCAACNIGRGNGERDR